MEKLLQWKWLNDIEYDYMCSQHFPVYYYSFLSFLFLFCNHQMAAISEGKKWVRRIVVWKKKLGVLVEGTVLKKLT